MIGSELSLRQYLRYLKFRFLDGHSREAAKHLVKNGARGDISEVIITPE